MSHPRRLSGRIVYIIVGIILFAAFFASRRQNDGPGTGAVQSRTPAGVMGTECRIRVIAGAGRETSAEQAMDRAESALRRVEALMSTWLDDSEISRLNRASAGDTVRLSAETMQTLGAARSFAARTDGAFDVTCRPLIELWRRAGKEGMRPSSAGLDAARAESNWESFILLEGGAVKSASSARVDLGGIAKGYGIDRAVDAIRSSGCSGGLVDVGGDLRCFGVGPEPPGWRVEIRSPFGDEVWGTLAVADRAVCTSGNYARFVEIEGVRYSHIVDPRTGIPADAVPSATVIAADATTADAWATALSVMGEEGIIRIDPAAGIEAMLVLGSAADYRIVMTPGFEPYLVRRPADWEGREVSIRRPGEAATLD